MARIALSSFISLLLAALLLLCLVEVQRVHALEDDLPAPMQVMPRDPTKNNNDRPKLLKPKTGIMKEDHDVDPGNQRARADEAILENAEEHQPEKERMVESIDDLTADDLLAMLNAAYRHDEL